MKKIGSQSIKFDNPITILETASIVGPKEAEGPMAEYFDKCLEDEFWGEKTWEKAESKLIREAVNSSIVKSKISADKIDYCFAGDLLNQCISSSFGLRELNVPFFGIFCSAEKQFRFPLELGNQRPPSSQWTVTGAGSAIVSKNGNGPYITNITTGKIVDMGIKDANNMGAAMAPAFVDTLLTHFKDTGRNPSYYDGIFSGDLGYIGKEIATELCQTKGYNIKNNYNDCGVMIFDKEKQDTHSGRFGLCLLRNNFFWIFI